MFIRRSEQIKLNWSVDTLHYSIITLVLHLCLEDEMSLVKDIEIQNWAAELADPEACQLKVKLLFFSIELLTPHLVYTFYFGPQNFARIKGF